MRPCHVLIEGKSIGGLQEQILIMKSDISHKQPPIAAYAEEPIRIYPEIKERDGDRREPTRGGQTHFPVSGEIYSAIRRQRGTTGVEYWKPHNTVHLPSHHKRSPAQSLFFPALEMNGLGSEKPTRVMRKRPDGTISNSPLSQFSRSNTIADMPVSRGRGSDSRSHSISRESSFHSVEPKKVVVTDLACIDIGDGTGSEESPKLSYFYQLYHAKFRYTDYFEAGGGSQTEDTMPLKPVSANTPERERVQQFHVRKPIKLAPSMRTMSLPSMTPHRKGSGEGPRVPMYTNTMAIRGPHTRRLDNGLYMDVFSRKPMRCPENGHGKLDELTIKGKVFSCNTYSSRNFGNRQTVAHIPERTRTRSASIPRAHLRKPVSGDRTRKRSVHFSVANEVYEYKPSDPVKS